jgi:hypothetical protein
LRFHVTTFLHHLNLLSTIFKLLRFCFAALSRTKIPPKGKRGFKFTIIEMENLLNVIKEMVLSGNPNWERVWDSHTTCYPKKERTAKSLRQKFQELARKKMPTGDPNCPPHICSAFTG